MPKLFGTSGIRGLANVNLTPALAARLGVRIATQTKAGTVLTARETGTTGSILENALVSGLVLCGSNVISIGNSAHPSVSLSH